MGQLELKQFMSVRRDRRRRRRRPRIESPEGLIASRGKRKCSPSQQDYVPGGSTSDQPDRAQLPSQHDSQTGETDVYSDPNLPEDIWHHIHSLMPLRDAARAACVSQSFKFSWRYYPNLIFKSEMFGLDIFVNPKETAKDFRRKIDHIMRNHSGTCVRKLYLEQVPNYNADDCSYLDRWLQKAVTPAIEELTLTLSADNHKYKFPCTLISNGMGDLLRCLYLGSCSFHPIAGLCCLKSLVKLKLFMVRIMEEELCSLISSSSALEWLSLKCCNRISCLKIPSHLQRLSHMEVYECNKLRIIESKAPNLSRFLFLGKLKVQLSLGEALRVKNLHINCTKFGCDTRAELESGTLSRKVITSPSVSSKFLELKYVNIELGELPYDWTFDCSSLVSSFSASDPSHPLRTFITNVSNVLMQHILVRGDPSESGMSGTGGALSPANKELVQLACHVLAGWLS